MDAPLYLHLKPGTQPPQLVTGPFKAVVIIEADVTPQWRALVSDWLVLSGCRYMMAWGRNCSEWDDSVDEASILAFGSVEATDNNFVMTTWHEKEPLTEAFWFSQWCAVHPSLELEQTYLIDVSEQDREALLLETFREALDSPDFSLLNPTTD
jgi:hypothetical protein